MDETQNVLKQILAHIQKNPNGFDKFAPAFVAAWGEIGSGVAKNANNPHFGNDYADLSAVMDLIKPVFARHKLALIQSPGTIDGDKIELLTFVMHDSGQHLMLRAQMPLGGKITAQSAGSAITYGRRYQAQAIAGLAPVDDDGEAASSAPTAAAKRVARKADPGDGTYAAAVETLLESIEGFAGTVEEMEAKIRPEVQELADGRVTKAYIAKRAAIKEAAKKGKR